MSTKDQKPFTEFKLITQPGAPASEWKMLRHMASVDFGVEIQLTVQSVQYHIIGSDDGARAVGLVSGHCYCHSMGGQPSVCVKLAPALAILR